jgi:hypothetical protein
LKTLVKSTLLIAFVGSLKAQSAFVYINEKVNGIDIPIERVECEITINDSIVKKKTSQNDGSIGRFSLEKGKHRIKASSEEFQDSPVIEFIVNESKTTTLSIVLIRLTPTQLEEKKKKLKKD